MMTVCIRHAHMHELALTKLGTPGRLPPDDDVEVGSTHRLPTCAHALTPKEPQERKALKKTFTYTHNHKGKQQDQGDLPPDDDTVGVRATDIYVRTRCTHVES